MIWNGSNFLWISIFSGVARLRKFMIILHMMHKSEFCHRTSLF